MKELKATHKPVHNFLIQNNLRRITDESESSELK